jgi:hypothetical protein
MPKTGKRESLTLVAGVLAAMGVAIAFYWPALGSYFASDDWVILHHYGPVPWWRLDAHFSPRTIWFYRPLQSAQFAALYQIFGLNAAAFNATLLAMHLVVLSLAFGFVARISGHLSTAAGVTLFFATSWIYADILIWKANINTLQWALATLAACAALERHLCTGRRAWRVACWVACGLAFLTKEQAVCLPLLLALVWWCARGWPANRDAVREGLRVLAVPCAMAAAYVVFHFLFVRNIEPHFKPGYSFANPLEGTVQILFALNHSLVPVYADPLLLAQWPFAQRAVAAAVRWFLLLGPLLAVYGWWRRDRVLLLGLGWIAITMVPVGFLESFHASRFYYLPALGAAMVQWRLLEHLVAWGRSRAAWRVVALAGAVAAGAWMVAANSIRLQQIIADDVRISRRMEALVRFLQEHRQAVEPGSVIVLRNAPQEFFNAGLGTREMVISALDDPTADGVVEGQPIETDREAQLKARPHRYAVDLARPQLTLRRVTPLP